MVLSYTLRGGNLSGFYEGLVDLGKLKDEVSEVPNQLGRTMQSQLRNGREVVGQFTTWKSGGITEATLDYSGNDTARFVQLVGTLAKHHQVELRNMGRVA